MSDKCNSCRHFAHDMDEAFCASDESYKASPTFGLSLNAMRREKGPCGPDAKLWVDKLEVPFE